MTDDWMVGIADIPVIICRLNHQGETIAVNPYIERITGYKPESLIGNNWWRIFYPGDLKKQVDILYDEFALGDVMDYEMALNTKSGERRIISWNSHNELDSEGNIVEIIGIGVDVTEKLRSERMLRLRGRLTSRIIEISPISIVVLNEKGSIVYANKQATEVLGISKTAIKGRKYNEPAWKITDVSGGPFPDEDLPFQKVMTTHEAVYDIVHAIEWPNGNRRILAINAAPILDTQEKIIGVAAVLKDITDSIQSQREIERYGRVLRVSYAVSQALNKAKDCDELLNQVCQILCDIGDYDLAWIGKPVPDDEDRLKEVAHYSKKEEYVDDLIDSCFDDGWCSIANAVKEFKIQMERDITCSDEDHSWREKAVKHGLNSIISIPLKLDAELNGILSVYSSQAGAFDEEEIKLLEQMTNDLEYGLESIRTREEYERMVEEIQNVSQRAMLYLDVLGHDLRNHLQAIALGIDIINIKTNNQDDERVNLIQTSVEKAKRLISNAKMIEEVITASPKSRTLKEVVENSAKTIRESYPQAQIHTESGDYDIKVLADDYLETALDNILENSITHNTSDVPEVWISIKKSDSEVVLSFADNGVGIPDHLKNEIMDSSRRYGGLGLHVARQIIQKNGGHILIGDRIEGDPNSGSRFDIQLLRENTSPS